MTTVNPRRVKQILFVNKLLSNLTCYAYQKKKSWLSVFASKAEPLFHIICLNQFTLAQADLNLRWVQMYEGTFSYITAHYVMTELMSLFQASKTKQGLPLMCVLTTGHSDHRY